jgi:hypothetical protein
MPLDHLSLLPVDAVCLTCGYPLRDLVSRACPECGRAFDPVDRLTFGLPARELGRPLEPPGRVTNLTALVLTALAVVDFSSPGSWMFGCVFEFAAAIALIWIAVRYVRQYSARRRRRLSATATPLPEDAPGLRWKTVPVCLVILLSLLPRPAWPLQLRFWVSKPALQREAQRVLAGGPGGKEQWVGLFHVSGSRLITPRAVFLTTGMMTLNELGLLYTPDPGTRLPPDYYMKGSLTSDWYVLAFEF